MEKGYLINWNAGNGSKRKERDVEEKIKIVSEEFDPPLNGTIKKIEITIHKPKPVNLNLSLKKILKLKHEKDMKDDLHTRSDQ
jgi:hypothetical protein